MLLGRTVGVSSVFGIGTLTPANTGVPGTGTNFPLAKRKKYSVRLINTKEKSVA